MSPNQPQMSSKLANILVPGGLPLPLYSPGLYTEGFLIEGFELGYFIQFRLGVALIRGLAPVIKQKILNNSSLSLTLRKCFNEDDGRGPKPERNCPRTFRMSSEAHRRQATTLSYSCAQCIVRSRCIWLITSSKTERACANR